MKEILNFTDEGIQFCLFIHNGNLVYAKRNDDNISYDINKNQKELIKNVFYSILPSKEITDLGYLKYEDKDINHLYDLKRHLHIFYENNYEITEDVLQLNYLFNNQKEYISSTNNKNYFQRSESRYVRRRVKVKDKIISVLVLGAVLVSSSLILMGYIEHSKVFLRDLKDEQLAIKYQETDIMLEDIYNAINNNSNLTLEEKEFLLSCPEYFQDNLKYFDYYTVINNLNNIYIKYVNEKSREGYYGDYTYSGKYKNRIRIYETTSLNDSSKKALSHEFLHLFTKQNTEDNYFYEIVNTVFNNEYFGKESELIYDNGYQTLRRYFYIIAEIIDPEVLRKYHADNNIDYLIDELVKIIPDRDLATNLFINIDSLANIDLLRNSNYQEFEKLSSEYQEKKQEILEILKQYYEIKYQTSIENDLNVFYWFNPNIAVTKLASELNLERNAIIYAEQFTNVKQFKKIFNKTGDDNLILSIPNSYSEVEKIYTLEEVLNGQTGYLYKTIEGIDLQKLPDGKYLGVIYLPSSYLDYEIPYEISKNLTNHI